MLGERLRVRLRSQLVEQLRRALDVREEEGDRAGRQVGAHVDAVSGASKASCELADGDHADEDEADDEHREDDVLAFLGDVGGDQRGDLEHRHRTLTNAAAMRRQRAVHRVDARLTTGELEERL